MYFISVGLPDDVARLIVDLKNDEVARMIVNAMRRCYMRKKGRTGSMQRAATELLEDMLEKGSVDADLIFDKAKTMNISIPVLNKAKIKMGVKSFKVGFGPGAAWHWELPEDHEIVKGNEELRKISGIRAMSYKAPTSNRKRLDQVLIDGRVHAEAQEYLRYMLNDGPRPSKEIYEIGHLTGVSQTAIKKAKKALNIISVKRGFSAGWDWKLP